MIGIWTWGLLRRRGGRLALTAIGVAAAVALLACLGSFVASAQATMTQRTAARSVVDWQVQVQPQASAATVLDQVRSTPIVRAAVPVGYAHTTGLSATTDGTTQTTGPGMVLGVPPDYSRLFPGVIRPLAGARNGVLVAQQAAANLHVKPGDVIHIGRAGLPPADVVVAGVVDLPTADQLFQKVGAPPGAQPTAPPDNVVLLGGAEWHQIFDPLSGPRPDLVATQIQADLHHHPLPPDPGAAYVDVTGAAHHLEARSAGGALVGDNLGSALAAARTDAAYAQILFVFLGVPAVVLAGLLTATVVATGGGRRRAEQSLLRARGAAPAALLRLAAAEAAVVGVGGAAAGVAAALVVGRAVFGTTGLISWTVGAVLAGLFIAALTVVAPVWRQLRQRHVTADTTPGPAAVPGWARWGLDFAALGACVALFFALRRAGYQLVLAPEGTPTISVSYWAFAAPALLWIGAALLTWRIADLLMGRGRRLVAVTLRPVAGQLAPIVAHTVARRRRSLAVAVVLLALAAAFAGSTAIFNATYRTQAEVDALLTNGADVTVTEPPGSSLPPQAASAFGGIPGVHAVEPIQHRFAYIGPDLQDLYGVNPDTIGKVTALPDSYFQGGTAKQLLAQLAAKPDSILVSAETVKDYQLRPGDTLNLRLIDSHTHQPVTVPFRFIGVVAEFPTAPKDSFFVADSAYVAAHTGSNAVGAFLIDTGSHNTSAVAAWVRALVGTSATVTDIATVRGTVGSSLTAVDLAGLTRIELAFGVLLAAAAAALVLTLRLTERRRNFAIATALGAGRRQLRAFVAADATLVGLIGLAGGALLGWGVAEMLVALLTGVFDPPPHSLTVPWPYLGSLAAAIITAIAVVAGIITRLARHAPLATLREL